MAINELLPTPDAEGVIYVKVQPIDALWSIAVRAADAAGAIGVKQFD
ncbi:MAG: hypothetical protein H6668_07195 [Ardenticatenaceae bacterium]|nr:hypothetical protein [Ardenticatenaceae bacterium]